MQHQIKSRAFRTTLSKLSSSSPQQLSGPHPKVKQRGVKSIMLNDIGNFPLIAANVVGGIALTSFGLRKLFYHPDIGISEVNRFSNEICNETIDRLESADQFRSQTVFFAKVLQPLSSAIMSAELSSPKGYSDETDKWSLSFIRNRDVMEPALENTNHFDDGLFETVKPSDFAKNQLDEYGHYRAQDRV